MKPKPTYLLTVVMMSLWLLCLPAYAGPEIAIPVDSPGQPAAAAGSFLADKAGLEKVIKIVKAKIDIPEQYDAFSSEVMAQEDGAVGRLHWSSQSTTGPEGGGMEITVDGYGSIIGFSHYRNAASYDFKRRLPGMGREQALQCARKFAYHICPEIVDQLDLHRDDVDCVLEYDGNYRLTFFRQHKGIPYDHNNISLTVKGDTGEVVNFYRNWTAGLEFPEPAGVMEPAAALAEYKKILGLTLRYRKTYGTGGSSTYLEYAPGSRDFFYCVDAFSGARVSEADKYYPRYDPYAYGRDMAGGAGGIASQEESDALKLTEGFVSVEDAVAAVKDISELGLDNGYRLNRYTYNKSAAASRGYIIRLEFTGQLSADDFQEDIPPEKEKMMAGEDMVVVALDAGTGEVLAVHVNGRSGRDEQVKYQRSALQEIAASFMEKQKAGKFRQAQLADSQNDGRLPGAPGYPSEEESAGAFSYVRVINGIPSGDNRMDITINQYTGKIDYYAEVWDDLDFVPADAVISPDQAYAALFAANQPVLKYVWTQAQPVGSAKEENSPGGGIRLVYGMDFNKPVCIDAAKGILISQDRGEPYLALDAAAYGDIGQHRAREQILALSRIGLLLQEESFRPDERISQKYFLYMINRMRGSYDPLPGAVSSLNQRDLDGMYRMLINEGIIGEQEKDPDAAVTREEAVKYLLKAAGYGKFAEIEGLYTLDCQDQDDVNPDLAGYLAIARALKIIDAADGFIRPKQELTRAEAAVILYNYLRI